MGKRNGAGDPACLLDGEVSGIGGPEPRLEMVDLYGRNLGGPGDRFDGATTIQGLRAVLGRVESAGIGVVDAVGYRVVHPGPKLADHQLITDEVLKDLEEAVAFAPLHDPAVIAVIRETMLRFPDVPHYACFDTVFHRTMPEEASVYPIPEMYGAQGVRRYGFHGLSCESIARQMAREPLGLPRRTVIAHLGSGCSVTAVVDGRSVDTTMGLTPTGGVVMGTRPGDLDPGLVLFLLRQQKGTAEEVVGAVETMLSHRAGMVALSGLSNDMKAVRKAAASGDRRAVLTLEVFVRSVRKAIGGFTWLMGGVDAVVFAGGIGEHDALTRAEVLGGLEGIGIAIDPVLNKEEKSGIRRIEALESGTAVIVVPAQEDMMIARHVERMEGATG